MSQHRPLGVLYLCALALSVLSGCSSTEILDNPKTAYVSEAEEPTDPKLVWTSRALTDNFDYLGQIQVRSWTYEGGLERLRDAGKQLRADAIIDVHYDRIGFFKTFNAFAIKYRTATQ